MAALLGHIVLLALGRGAGAFSRLVDSTSLKDGAAGADIPSSARHAAVFVERYSRTNHTRSWRAGLIDDSEDHVSGSAKSMDRFLQASTTCELCAGQQQWLFVLAPEQRSSKPVVDILNAIPGYALKSQQGGNVYTRLQELYQVARQINERNLASDPAWKSNPISESQMLCGMQKLTRELIVGHFDEDLTSVIGFDESWNASDPDQLQFLYKLFPCGRFLVYPGAEETPSSLIAKSRSGENLTRSDLTLQFLASQREFMSSHPRSFHILHGDLSAANVNAVLEWLGVSGCHFQASPAQSSTRSAGVGTASLYAVQASQTQNAEFPNRQVLNLLQDPEGGGLRLAATSAVRVRVDGKCRTKRWTTQ